MTKYIGYIIAAAILIAGLFLWSSIEARHASEMKAEKSQHMIEADSLRASNAALSIAMDTLIAQAARHTGRADSIAETNVVTLILNDARKATRNATVDSVGAILDRSPE